MTHSYVWHDSFICVTWLIHTCDMTHSCVWHDSFICVTRLSHICDMTHLRECHGTFVSMKCVGFGVCGLKCRIEGLRFRNSFSHLHECHDKFVCMKRVGICIRKCALVQSSDQTESLKQLSRWSLWSGSGVCVYVNVSIYQCIRAGLCTHESMSIWIQIADLS